MKEKIRDTVTHVCLGLLLTLFLPLILLSVLAVETVEWLKLPKRKREYHDSNYYREQGVKFNRYIQNKACYRFYNGARERNLLFQYIRDTDGVAEGFCYEGTLFIFPTFAGPFYSELKKEWIADFDEDEVPLEEEYSRQKSCLREHGITAPVKYFVERADIPTEDLVAFPPPEYVYVVQSYETAFAPDAAPVDLRYPQTTQELFQMMQKMPRLCGDFSVENGGLIWDLYEDVRVYIAVDEGDCIVDIQKKGQLRQWVSLTHWHPRDKEILHTVRTLGTPGNGLVIDKVLFGETVRYMGPLSECPYSSKKLGRYYLVAK